MKHVQKLKQWAESLGATITLSIQKIQDGIFQTLKRLNDWIVQLCKYVMGVIRLGK
jgi:hypothetical protein